MKKHIILVSLFVGISGLAQVKSAPKTISSRINVGGPKPRLLEAAIKEYTIYFKGFSVKIYDEAADELGNHMLIGRIKALVRDEKKRDPLINKSIDFSIGFYDDHPVLISTDKNYKVLKVSPTFSTQVISYDKKSKKFILGSNNYDHKEVGKRYLGEWQPMILVVSLEHYGTAFTIKNDYSCYLKDLIIEEDKIRVLTASEERTEKIISDQKLEIITVDLNKFHADTEVYLPKVLDPISRISPDYIGVSRMDVSAISKVDSTYYFSTSNLDQTNLINGTHLYKYDGKTIEDQEDFKYFADQVHDNPDLVNVSGFYTNASKEYIFLTQKFTNKEMYLTKTNAYFGIKKSVKIDLFDYFDYGKMVVLPNGNYCSTFAK